MLVTSCEQGRMTAQSSKCATLGWVAINTVHSETLMARRVVSIRHISRRREQKLWGYSGLAEYALKFLFYVF